MRGRIITGQRASILVEKGDFFLLIGYYGELRYLKQFMSVPLYNRLCTVLQGSA